MELAAAILTPITFLALAVLERARPGRRQPMVPGWYLKGTLWFLGAAAAYLVVVPAIAAAVTPSAPLHIPAYAALLVFVLADALGWFVHHALHRVGPLWRWAHQLHHSAERIDVVGAMYLHPFDVALQIGALALATALLGIPREGAALASYFALSAQLFVHTNVRTPQRLGWIVQRPEAHSVHHQRGLHAYNYGLLTLWDRMFGTFRNPATFSVEPVGFWNGSSRCVLDLLVGRDVREPSTGDSR